MAFNKKIIVLTLFVTLIPRALVIADSPKISAPTKSKSTNTTAELAPASPRKPNPTLSIPWPLVYAPTRPRLLAGPSPWKNDIVSTIFWVGEGPTTVSATTNVASSWDVQWQVSFGGFDDPDPAARHWEFRPKDFIPKQNPFYVALPFNDLTNREAAARLIPWYRNHPNRGKGSVCKGTWLAIRFGKRMCFAQWEDCGPFVTDDWAYVFGPQPQPRTTMNNGVGIDLSPAVRDYLGLVSGMRVDWRFCSIEEVPDGPWRRFGDNNPFAKETKKTTPSYSSELLNRRQEWLKTQYDPKRQFPPRH